MDDNGIGEFLCLLVNESDPNTDNFIFFAWKCVACWKQDASLFDFIKQEQQSV